MVLLKVKGKGEKDVFLFETTAAAPVDGVITEVVEIWNMRLRVKWYITNGEELAKETKCEQLKKACEDASAQMAMQRARERQTDRQTDGQTDRQTDR